MTAVAFVALAALGTLVRAGAVHALNRPAWPVGTLLVNLSGSFALGLLGGATTATATAIGIGGIGSLTTFSTVAQEIAVMARTGMAIRAALYAAVTLTAGTAAAVAGLEIA